MDYLDFYETASNELLAYMFPEDARFANRYIYMLRGHISAVTDNLRAQHEVNLDYQVIIDVARPLLLHKSVRGQYKFTDDQLLEIQQAVSNRLVEEGVLSGRMVWLVGDMAKPNEGFTALKYAEDYKGQYLRGKLFEYVKNFTPNKVASLYLTKAKKEGWVL